MSPGRIRPGSGSADKDKDKDKEQPLVADELVPEAPDETPDQLDEHAPGPAEVTESASLDARDAALDEMAAGVDDESEEEIVLPKPVVQRGARHHSGLYRIYYGETRIDFVRRKRIWFTISAIVILAGVLSLFTRGLNLGIEFEGGTAWTVQSSTLSVASARSAVSPYGLSGATITILGTGSQRQIEVQDRIPKSQNEAEDISSALARTAHTSANNVSVEAVGPSWGGEITNKAIEALIVFFILVALYISVFFEFRMAFAAIVAVAHDVLVTVGIYSLSGLQVTPDTVVAFLTILGYSLYDTIVVFDRVRDNVKQFGASGRLTFSDLVNVSMNQTLARSLNTSLVAILPILAVLVLGAEVLGATTLQYFGFALLIGLMTGAYSSIFIASPLVAVLKEREPRYRVIRERLEARGGALLLLSAADIAAGALGEGAASQRRARPGARAGAQGGASATADGTANGDGRGAATSGQRASQPRAAASGSAARRPAARSRRRKGRR